MKLFGVNLIVALCWALVTGELTALNLGIGFGAGFAVLWLLEPVHGDRGYHRWPWQLCAFIVWYLLELIRSSLRVAQAVLGPMGRLRDGWLEVRLQEQSDVQIALFANLISLTPGTLSVDVSPERRVLLVHALLAEEDDEREVERQLEVTLQRRLLTLTGSDLDSGSGSDLDSEARP